MRRTFVRILLTLCIGSFCSGAAVAATTKEVAAAFEALCSRKDLGKEARKTVLVMGLAVGTTDCKEAGKKLSTVQSLDLSGTGISDLSPLAVLTQLRKVNLSHNPVSSISALTVLSNLQELLLNFTAITDLSPLWLESKLAGVLALESLKVLELYSNERFTLATEESKGIFLLKSLTRLRLNPLSLGAKSCPLAQASYCVFEAPK